MDARHEVRSVRLHRSHESLLRELLGNETKDEFALLLNSTVPEPAGEPSSEEPPSVSFPELSASLTEISSSAFSETLCGIVDGTPSWADIARRMDLRTKLKSISKIIMDGIPTPALAVPADEPCRLLLEASAALLAAKSVEALKREIDEEMERRLRQVAERRKEAVSAAKDGKASDVELITIVYRAFRPELEEFTKNLEAGLLKDLACVTSLVTDICRAARHIEGEA
jgi:hypothetical protein